MSDLDCELEPHATRQDVQAGPERLSPAAEAEDAVTREEYEERKATLDRRMDQLEQTLGGLVTHLEDRLAANGYFGDGPKADHPLAGRLSELEERLSWDVWKAALSKKLRRVLVVGVLVSVLALAGGAAALGEDSHVNNVIQHNAAVRDREMQAVIQQMQDNDQSRTSQIERVIKAIEANSTKLATSHKETQAEITQILHVLKQLAGASAKHAAAPTKG